MSNSLISYDYVLKPTDVRMVLCDHFMEGAFKENEILLCANTLMRKSDFDNAMKRMLIKLYDQKRSSAYKSDNCKHLACTEVRAALFSSKCNPKERTRFKFMSNNKTNKEKKVANEFCVKDLAIEHLKERSKCEDKADRYVDYIFEKCKADLAPMNQIKANKLKSFTDIM